MKPLCMFGPVLIVFTTLFIQGTVCKAIPAIDPRILNPAPPDFLEPKVSGSSAQPAEQGVNPSGPVLPPGPPLTDYLPNRKRPHDEVEASGIVGQQSTLPGSHPLPITGQSTGGGPPAAKKAKSNGPASGEQEKSGPQSTQYNSVPQIQINGNPIGPPPPSQQAPQQRKIATLPQRKKSPSPPQKPGQTSQGVSSQSSDAMINNAIRQDTKVSTWKTGGDVITTRLQHANKLYKALRPSFPKSRTVFETDQGCAKRTISLERSAFEKSKADESLYIQEMKTQGG